MKYHLLLLEDIVNHGRKGELVHAAPGFARNYLLPQGKALLATRSTIRLREKLKAERDEQAAIDRKESLAMAEKMQGTIVDTVVKVDQEGHLYGSVTAADISKILEENGFKVEKKCISLHHPIRQIGVYQVSLTLPEEIEATVGLEVKPDRKIIKKKVEVAVEAEANAETEEGAEEGASKDDASVEEAAKEEETKS